MNAQQMKIRIKTQSKPTEQLLVTQEMGRG